MARISWTLFGLILMMVVGAAMLGVGATGDEERAMASSGVRGATAGGGEAVGGETATGAVGGYDQRVGRGAHLEEGEASGVRGGDDSTFQNLPELSNGSRPSRLHQGMIFELFEAERGRCRQSGEGTSAPVIEEEELGSEDSEDDADFDMEAEVPREEEDEEEQEQEDKAEERPAQVHGGAKRRRIYEGVGIAGWSTLQGDGPLEGYRCRPTAMLRFRTIHDGQVDTSGLK